MHDRLHFEPRSAQAAVFVDRDGTINRDFGFVHRPEQLELLDGAAEGLRRMAALGYRLVIVTNQSGIARGYFAEADMHAFNAALCQRLAADGVTIDAIYFSPYHPAAVVEKYRRDSECRKPCPGMILRAAADHGLDLAASVVIGDKPSDVLAGARAGCRTIRIRSEQPPQGALERAAMADFLADDLRQAAAHLEQLAEPRSRLTLSDRSVA